MNAKTVSFSIEQGAFNRLNIILRGGRRHFIYYLGKNNTFNLYFVAKSEEGIHIINDFNSHLTKHDSK